MSFSDFERRTEKHRIALRLISLNSITKWEGQLMADFNLVDFERSKYCRRNIRYRTQIK